MVIKQWKNMPQVVTHVGWNDKKAAVLTNFDLGRGVFPKHRWGVRRAIWDAAFGYVNGFRKRDIFYFVLTRSLSKRIWNIVYNRNNRRGDNDFPCSSLALEMREFCIRTGNHF